MEFSIKAQQLQQQQDTAVLYIGTKDTAPTASLLAALQQQCLKNQDDFISIQQVIDDVLNACALVCLDKTDVTKLKKVAAKAAAWAASQQKLAVDLSALSATEAQQFVFVFTVALGDAVYRYDEFKEDSKPAVLDQVSYYGSQPLEAQLRKAEALVYGMNICKNLGNAPGNVCTPTFLASEVQKIADQTGCEASIFDAGQIRQMGMNALWAVAQGSEAGAYLLQLSYQGAPNANDAPIVLVGKGITFDSGGISLKPAASMDEMKYDMCGAASVIGTLAAAAKLRLPINVVAIVPTCENMPSGQAVKPGDIVKSMNGLSIEVLNTDAEGRLILCDALTYAERFQPKAVIDVATLTGACIIALGHVAQAVLGNDQQVIDDLMAAAQDYDDKTWPLPLFDEYKEQLKSNFADLQNIGGRPAGTITAAAFLSYFTEKYSWAHLDIAGTAWKSGADKGATGRPVPLLLAYLCQQAKV
ncbi:leucyl aminopeptidase [Neisseriaceae bacterium ESL0693]|nr:leucyl aminopeptidase [Neisseriaceae bacterium ESL0693]